MQFLSSLFGIALIIFRIGVPVYLYVQARDRRFEKPWLWILFGVFEPIVALMFHYLIVNILPGRNPH